MAHRTLQLGPSARLAARTRHYGLFALVFLLVYGGIRVALGSFPDPLLFGILLVSLAKDLVDEYRLRHGGQPLAYAGIEHAPSNVVLLAFLVAGVIVPAGSPAGVPAGYWAGGLAVVDLVFDLSQDLRA